VEQYGFTRLSLAAPIKLLGEAARCQQWDFATGVLETLFPCLDDLGRATRVFSDLAADYEVELGGGGKPRGFLQALGQRMRERVYRDVWVDYLIARMRVTEGPVVVDDLRYRNEARALRGEGVRLVRLCVDEAERRRRVQVAYPELEPALLDHVSEHNLDDWCFDWTISTNTEGEAARQLEVFMAANPWLNSQQNERSL